TKIDRQPNRVLPWIGPLYAVPAMGGNVEERARRQRYCLRVALEADSGSAPEEHHPFVVVLVVPESFGRTMAVGHDALETHMRRREQRLHKLIRHAHRQ